MLRKIVFSILFLLIISSYPSCFAAFDPNMSLGDSTDSTSSLNSSINKNSPQELTAAPPQHAKPRIALIIKSDAYSDLHDKTAKAIRDSLNAKFPKSKYILEENKQFYQALLTCIEDNNLYDMSMVNREMLSSLGNKYDYDYVMLLDYSFGTSNLSSSFWTSTYKVSVILKAKVVNVKTKEYLYRQDLSVAGQSYDAFGDPSFQSATNKSMINTTNKFCEEIKIDSNTL